MTSDDSDNVKAPEFSFGIVGEHSGIEEPHDLSKNAEAGWLKALGEIDYSELNSAHDGLLLEDYSVRDKELEYTDIFKPGEVYENGLIIRAIHAMDFDASLMPHTITILTDRDDPLVFALGQNAFAQRFTVPTPEKLKEIEQFIHDISKQMELKAKDVRKNIKKWMKKSAWNVSGADFVAEKLGVAGKDGISGDTLFDLDEFINTPLQKKSDDDDDEEEPKDVVIEMEKVK